MKINKYVIIGAVVSLGVCSYLFFQISLKQAISLVEVPFVINTIYPHQQVRSEDIEIREIPSYYVENNVWLKKDEIVGKYVDLQSKLVPGMLFYKHLLIDESAVQDLPMLLLKPNQSAFAYATDLYKSLGNSLEINQKVDLYFTYYDKSVKKTYVDCLVNRVRIIGIKDRNGLDIHDVEAKSIPSVILLAIDSGYIDLVKKASKLGTIDLSAPNVDYVDDSESILNEECKGLVFLRETDEQ